MAFDPELTGAMFKNKQKEPGDNRPDYKGNVQIRGHKYDIAGWIKEPKAGGAKYMSLKLSEPRQQEHDI